MISSSILPTVSAGCAKDRADFYLFDYHLNNAINILEPFVNSLTVDFDIEPRNTPDPTGMEHPTGLALGQINGITSINGYYCANFADECFSLGAESKFFIEAERKRGNKFHIGIPIKADIDSAISETNEFNLYVDYEDTKRLLYAMKLAKETLS